ncbi:UxaA family hydrolase [Candidatus Aerophobetes bacterium]|nr:UxaA family hydrolase [Candidatus Aerophobetes bacterium]
MPKALIINSIDNVATAIADIEPGEVISLKIEEKTRQVNIRERIPFGHKFALKKIRKGESIVKYGEKIGRATQDIESGFHVHIHNVESLRGRGDIKG